MFPLNDPSTPGLGKIIKPLELFKKRLYNLYKYRSFDNPVSSGLELSLKVGHRWYKIKSRNVFLKVEQCN